MLNSQEIRCSNIVKKRNEETRRCDAFLAELNVYEIRLRCPRCGTLYVATKRMNNTFDVKGFVKGKHIIECKHED